MLEYCADWRQVCWNIFIYLFGGGEERKTPSNQMCAV